MKNVLQTPVAPSQPGARKSVFVALTAHFFRRFFTGEMLSSEADLRLGIGGIIALLALPGGILSLLLLPKYSSFLRWLAGHPFFDFNQVSIPDKYILLTLTMTITGIVAVLKWQALFPDRTDYSNLAVLPFKPWLIVSAKFTALILFVALVVLALNVVSTVLFPVVVLESQTSSALLLRFMTAHFVATTAGSAFMFCFFLALSGLLMTLLPANWFARTSNVAQFAFTILLVMLLLAIPETTELLKALKPSAVLDWLPTAWFLGLYQQVFGVADQHFHLLAQRALRGLGISAGAALFFYAVSYQRHFRRIPESAAKTPRGPSRLRRSVQWCFESVALRKPFDEACFRFALKTIARSQLHRLALAGFLGLGLAISIQQTVAGWTVNPPASFGLPSAVMLSPALTFIFFFLTGLSFAFTLPAELSANWCFRVSGEFGTQSAKRVARKLMFVFLLPMILVVFVMYSSRWGFEVGIVHTVFIVLASLLLVEALLLDFGTIPFTRSHAIGKHNTVFVLSLYVLAFFIFSSGFAHLEYWALRSRSAIAFFILFAFFAISLGGLRVYSRELDDVQPIVIFHDEVEPAVRSMDLHLR